MAQTLSRSLARLIRNLPSDDANLAQAERFVRDWLGSMVAGRSTAPGTALLGYGRHLQDPESRVFLAAALSHITETDDLHRTSITHPGCVVIPTCLVLGRTIGAAGRVVLRAVLAGYEAILRVGEALGPGHYRLFHNTATAGVFGSAAAAAALLDLDEDQWVWALGNAGTQAAGLWQFNEDGAMSKHLHAGHAAHVGLRSAMLAKEGFTGATGILEGERGFFPALCPDPDVDAVLREANGWKLPETSLKPYPCCRHTHPAVDAALELRARLLDNGSLAGVREVRISTYPAALRVTDNPVPTTPYAAKFSLQFCVATALANGTPGLASFDTERLDDPVVLGVLGKMTVKPDSALERAYPQRWGARIRVESAGGETYEAERPVALGDPEAPIGEEALDAKIASLCEYGGLGSEDVKTLLSASSELVSGGPVFDLPVFPD